jgi:hypothetical protein
MPHVSPIFFPFPEPIKGFLFALKAGQPGLLNKIISRKKCLSGRNESSVTCRILPFLHFQEFPMERFAPIRNPSSSFADRRDHGRRDRILIRG